MNLLSMKEVAEIMGFSAKNGHKTVQGYIKKGLLPSVRLGRTVRINEDVLKAFISDRVQQTAPDTTTTTTQGGIMRQKFDRRGRTYETSFGNGRYTTILFDGYGNNVIEGYGATPEEALADMQQAFEDSQPREGE